MPKWYHRASWSLLRSLYSPRLLMENNVRARGVESLPEPPFLLLADHSNALDAYVLGSFFKEPIRYMANIEGVHPLAAHLAELIGAYGRRKAASDIASLRRTFELSRSGEAIGIFPEGDRSWDGSSSAIRPGVGKLARRLGLPLVLARQAGNYLSHPRWASRPRRGSWELDFLVYGADELGAMTDALVHAVISNAIAKDEIKEAQRRGQSFSGEGLAEGIGLFLWRCPVCGKPDRIRGRGDEVACLSCGSRWALDANCRLRSLNAPLSIHAADISDLKDWHDWQVASLPELAAGASRRGAGLRSEGVLLTRREGPSSRRLGRGLLYLEGRGKDAELVFEGPGARAVFEAAEVSGFVDNFNAFSEFDHRGQRWRVEFGGGNAAKWAYALRGGALSGGAA
jgi:hypothetical protein